MAGKLTRILFQPGWRLRCIDPPIGWVRQTDRLEVRLQLTCYLTSRWARSVWVKDARLRVFADEEGSVLPWVASADADGLPFGAAIDYLVGNEKPHHAFVDFGGDVPAVVEALSHGSVAADVEARFNDGVEFRKIADLDLTIDDITRLGSVWQRLGTGRDLKKGT